MNVNPKYIFFLFYVLVYDYQDIISIQYMFHYQFNLSRPCDSISEVKFSSWHINKWTEIFYKLGGRKFSINRHLKVKLTLVFSVESRKTNINWVFRNKAEIEKEDCKTQ